MDRLLQGDVGSGKTVVALYALLRAVEDGLPGRADGADRDARRAALPHARGAVPELGVRVRAADELAVRRPRRRAGAIAPARRRSPSARTR